MIVAVRPGRATRGLYEPAAVNHWTFGDVHPPVGTRKNEMAAKIEPTDRQSAGAGTGSDDRLSQQLSAIPENVQYVGFQPGPLEENEPVKRDDLRSGVTPYLDQETSERKAIYDRLVAIENQMKKRGSGRFTRYLVAILIGVAATLAWQSYGESAKQIVAAKAPELGWSPQATRMIASWTAGWTKLPPGPEKIAPETVAPKAPPASSVDPAQVQQIAQSLAAQRQIIDQLAGGQDQMGRNIARLEAAVAELIAKIPEPPAKPPVAPARKPAPVPPSSRAPIAPRQ
jgi:hypothetical protein